MPVYRVVSDDTGKEYRVTTRDPADPAALQARVRRFEGHAGYDLSDLLMTRFMQAVTLGGMDEIEGAVTALTKEFAEVFGGEESDFAQAYQDARLQNLARAELAGVVAPKLAMATDAASLLFGGSAAGPVVREAVQGVAGLAPRVRDLMKEGFKVGAGLGGIGGVLSGEGVEGRVAGGIGGALLGGPLGALTPAAFVKLPEGIDFVRKFFRGDENAGLRYLNEVMRREGVSVEDVVTRMERGQELGVPVRIADVASGMRAALGASTRAPSELRTQTLNRIRERQSGTNDRIRAAIERDLGPISNLRKQEEELRERARQSAAPYYERAYATRVPVTDTLTGILNTPAGQRALNRARRIAADERRDPTTLGFDIAEGTNEVVLTRQPSMQTLDYVKRGFDDELNTFRDPTTGILRLDEGGRAIATLQREFVNELDRLNPDYAQARARWGGEVSKTNAMQDGAQALNYSAEDLEFILSLKSPVEQEYFRLGYRKALADQLDKKTDFADLSRVLLGTKKRRDALQVVFGDTANLNRFADTVANEGLVHYTYSDLTGNSRTAERIFEALDYTDSLAGISGGGASILRSDPGGLFQAALGKMVLKAKQKTQQAADETIMNILMNPTATGAREDLERISALEAAEALTRTERGRRGQIATLPTTLPTGRLAGPALSETPEERRPLLPDVRRQDDDALIRTLIGGF